MFFSILIRSIFNYLQKKNDLTKPNIACINNQMYKILEYQQSIITLIISGQSVSCLPQIRIMYEAYIIMQYLDKYPELSQRYIDHTCYSEYKIWKNSEGDVPNNILKGYEEVQEKYENDFFYDYGWTASKILKKNDRKLITMAKDVGMDNYPIFYRLTSEAIHSSSYFINNELNKKIIDEYITIQSIDFLTNSLICYLRTCNIKENERIYIRNIIYQLKDGLLQDEE